MTERTPPYQRHYLYNPDANSYAGVGFSMDDDDAITEIRSIDLPMLASWKPLRCHVFDDNPPIEGDFPSNSNYRRVPIMSERAWTVLRPLIGFSCEALPIIHPSGRAYFIVHVMKTIDCLDVDASTVSRCGIGDDRIDRIYRYAFKQRMLSGEHIFKLPLLCGGELIVDDDFRKAVERNRLHGLTFRELPMNSPA
jgi:hypothetical protein